MLSGLALLDTKHTGSGSADCQRARGHRVSSFICPHYKGPRQWESHQSDGPAALRGWDQRLWDRCSGKALPLGL